MTMIDARPALSNLGRVLCILAVSMLAPALADALAGTDGWRSFLPSAGLTGFVGAALVLATRERVCQVMTVRQIYLSIALCWIVPCFFAALPMTGAAAHLSFIDALFEATSGLTSTGSTVMTGLNHRPPGILLWRALMQWMGGIGIIVMAVTALPALHIGGMQIFRAEVVSANDRAIPRIARIGNTIIAVYMGFTLVLGVGLWLAGMVPFDAIIYAMSTIATGGFSNHDNSLAFFNNGWIDGLIYVGMVLGGMPFLLFFQLTQGNWRRVVHDQQLHWYLGLLFLAGLGIGLWLFTNTGMSLLSAFHHGFFTVASVMTGTGLASMDYGAWTGMPSAILFLLIFVGGCAGSTAAGIKVFRLQLLYANALIQTRQLLRPHAVMVPTYNKKPIGEDVLESVMGFLFVYVFSFAVVAILLSLMGLDFLSSVSASAAAISNVGPGLGPVVGPAGTFATVPDGAKLLLSATMLFGRLEMFTLLVLFVPNFWKH